MAKYFVSYAFGKLNMTMGFGNAEIFIKGKFDKVEVRKGLLATEKCKDVGNLSILFFQKI